MLTFLSYYLLGAVVVFVYMSVYKDKEPLVGYYRYAQEVYNKKTDEQGRPRIDAKSLSNQIITCLVIWWLIPAAIEKGKDMYGDKND